MYTKSIKRSAIALAITGAISSGAYANDYTKYNLTNQKQIKATTATKKSQNIIGEATSWLIKLNAPAAVNASALGKDIASVHVEAKAAQASVEQAITNMDLPVQVVAKTSTLVSSVVVNGNKNDVLKLLTNSNVYEIYPVYDYELHVADSADYIEATPLVANGLATGEGIRVAVLDTGIDYTHAAFGGEGTEEAYAAAAADPAAVDWPQGIVMGGYDFINNDADPLDLGTSHGTHVSHSVTGIAPNVDLFVYSVCNSGCPGSAQLLALESAMDPNGDGDISDRVDVVNMSLGGDYGDIATSAVALFINEAVKLGTNVVISAGNDGAYPFIVGGPSTTENALSVGAMTHPTDEDLIGSGTIAGEEALIKGANFGPQTAFSFNSDDIELVYPDANQTACDSFADGVDFTGKAVLVDRGGCAFVTKVLSAQEKGAAFVIIANNKDDGEPAPMGGSSTEVTIPSVGVTLQSGDALKAGGGFDIIVESKVLSGAIASFTSRGPSMGGRLKPEITAPGRNIQTASPGTGTGLSGATGTSFSSPITAGAMSLLKEALPDRNGFELKATLMNSANLDVTMEPRAVNPDTELAPISYIGAGLVDVNKAANLPVAAWAKDTKQAALSFGLVNASEVVELTKTVQVKNFSNDVKVYSLSLEQRYQNDIDRGSFSLDYPDTITVPAGQTISFDVTAKIDPATLPEWTLDAANIGSQAVTTDLTNLELDGALVFSEGSEKAFHLVYHVLPKANAKVSLTPVMTENGPAHKLTNTGAVTLNPIFVPAVMTDEIDEDQRFDLVGGSVETFAVSPDICDSGYVTMTTIVLDKGITHTYVGGFMADFDLDRDGNYDFTVQNGKIEWFDDDAEPGNAESFTHAYGRGRGDRNNIYQVVGNNHMTLQACLDSFDLTADAIGNVTADIRFRVEEDTWKPIATGKGDMAMGTYTFTDATNDVYASLEDESGNPVTSLAPGESAILTNEGKDFLILSDSGSKIFHATPQADNDTPPILADAEFSVDENTANGSVIGSLQATYGAGLANPVSEYIVMSSTSTAVSVTKQGDVVVANAEVLDYDSGLMMVELEVVAVDTAGNISDSAMVTVNVMNVADEPVEVTPVMDAEQMSFTVQENAAQGTVIGSVTATDPDPDTTPITGYTVTGSESVTISETGEISVAGAIDYEATTELALQVTAVDSAGNESEAMMVKVAVTNIADEPVEVTPVMDAEEMSFTVQENAAQGTVIGSVTATDPDPDTTPITSFTVTGSDSVAISETGELSVAGAIDYEATTELSLQVTAVDSAGNESEPMTVTVEVTQDPSEDVVPEPEKKKSSSGSLAWFTLLAAPFALMRRRKQK